VTVRAVRLVAAAAGLALAVSVGLAASSTATEPVTFSNQIARLFQTHCQGCHRPGEIAPFALTSYADAYTRRQKIRHVTRKRVMPPWKPVPGVGDFLDARRLSDTEIALIERWVAAGAPEGDPRDLPPPREFPDTWTLGPPDLVLQPAVDYPVAGRDDDLYRCFTIPTSFAEDRWVSAAEIVPGNRRIVHHVLTFVDTSGRSVALDDADPEPGYSCFGGPGFLPAGGLGGWAPGARPHAMPDGVGMLLPAGARVVVQVHYHHRGRGTEADRTRVGLHFATRPIDRRVRVIPILNRGFLIPAGASRHAVTASYTLPPAWNVHAIAISPHMHLLGREMTVTATYPDGSTRPLIRIDDWDFHWQGSYTYAQPVPLPGGTRIDLTAVYDNSTANRRNPSTPPRPVGWGEATTDEMCIAFLRVTVDAERLNHRPPSP
jgi:mono/diheme cytochrome c family protein